VLERDGYQCRACGSADGIAVHHRRPGFDATDDLITLCTGCHARVHKLLAIRVWLPETLVVLWAEQHPNAPVQMQFGIAA
jgi:5-methylcytosine-specific restriction endonuclease McrA